jgi:RNA polymerase sigma factor (sigma-70 family)
MMSPNPFPRLVQTAGETVPDAVLLRRFVADQDHAAFELLARRHADAVWTACRKVLNHDTDAEDAFQATFVALSRHASKVREPGTLAGWLYRVAVNAALRIRTARPGAEPLSDRASPTRADSDRIAHEELAKLPDKYRLPVVLCDLEGHTHAEAANILGWPVGTVSGRLARARDQLKVRLLRRGVTGKAVLTAAIADSIQTGRAAAMALGALPVPAAVSSLSEAALTATFAAKWKLWTAAAATLLAFAGAGTYGATEGSTQTKSTTSAKEEAVRANEPLNQIAAFRPAATSYRVPSTFEEAFTTETIEFAGHPVSPYVLAAGRFDGLRLGRAIGPGQDHILLLNGFRPADLPKLQAGDAKSSSGIYLLENDGSGIFSQGKAREFKTNRLHRIHQSPEPAGLIGATLVKDPSTGETTLFTARLNQEIEGLKPSSQIKNGIHLIRNPWQGVNNSARRGPETLPMPSYEIGSALRPHVLAAGKFSVNNYDLAVGCASGDEGAVDGGLLLFEPTPAGPWIEHVIDSDMHDISTLEAAKIRRVYPPDGRDDLVVSGKSNNQCQLVWYENPGDLTKPWVKHVICNSAQAAHDGHVVRVDFGNGVVRCDILMIFDYDIVWFENQGDGTKWNNHFIGSIEGTGHDVWTISLARGGFKNGLTLGPDDPNLAVVAISGGEKNKWGDQGKGFVTLFVRENPELRAPWKAEYWRTGPWKALRATIGPGRFNSLAVGDFNGDGFDDFVVTRGGGDSEDRGVYVFLQKAMKR